MRMRVPLLLTRARVLLQMENQTEMAWLSQKTHIPSKQLKKQLKQLPRPRLWPWRGSVFCAWERM